eukprot:CAMPEP_0171500352 /NCGR_PEP_ID=MMETSP0958-20121227/8941_1 /TAXON_ID=87120 /ORGANISM="Aurantiochytrium limacinum, Strain ATCCMYA-1381" /LENGTH=363 /DNA_ID=CAMNT_0012035019 /DNA_START=93 /DNA_END=1184 /DNA_ORIENTATION=-
MKTPYDEQTVKELQALNPTWQHSMIRCKDPKVSVEFYKQHFGCTLVNEYHFPEHKFSLYFLATLPADLEKQCPAPGTPEAHKFLFDCRKGLAMLELTHNHGSENETDLPLRDVAERPQMFHDGNSDPRGFGHIAFNTNDVYAAAEKLEQNGVPFKKRPDEGRMKGIAFCLDPDGFWIELVPAQREVEADRYNLSQTMIRITDPNLSIPFYRDLFGMEVVRESHYDKDKGDFSLFFLATQTEELEKLKASGCEAITKTLWDPCLELTWNHGTENEEGPQYHNGNDTEFNGKSAPKGFGHLAFLLDDVEKCCDILAELNVPFVQKTQDGLFRKVAFVKDPTGYWIELIQRDLPAEILMGQAQSKQ